MTGTSLQKKIAAAATAAEAIRQERDQRFAHLYSQRVSEAFSENLEILRPAQEPSGEVFVHEAPVEELPRRMAPRRGEY